MLFITGENRMPALRVRAVQQQQQQCSAVRAAAVRAEPDIQIPDIDLDRDRFRSILKDPDEELIVISH